MAGNTIPTTVANPEIIPRPTCGFNNIFLFLLISILGLANFLVSFLIGSSNFLSFVYSLSPSIDGQLINCKSIHILYGYQNCCMF